MRFSALSAYSGATHAMKTTACAFSYVLTWFPLSFSNVRLIEMVFIVLVFLLWFLVFSPFGVWLYYTDAVAVSQVFFIILLCFCVDFLLFCCIFVVPCVGGGSPRLGFLVLRARWFFLLPGALFLCFFVARGWGCVVLWWCRLLRMLADGFCWFHFFSGCCLPGF